MWNIRPGDGGHLSTLPPGNKQSLVSIVLDLKSRSQVEVAGSLLIPAHSRRGVAASV